MTAPQNPFDPPVAAAPTGEATSMGQAVPSGYAVPTQPWGAPPAYGAVYGQPGAPVGVPDLASPWIRLGANLLNAVLMVLTLGIGYLVWTMVLWQQGTNPAKKMLGLKVVHADTGADVTWNHMAIRCFCVPLAFACVPVVGALMGLVDALMIFGDRHQRLTDKWAHTLVVRT